MPVVRRSSSWSLSTLLMRILLWRPNSVLRTSCAGSRASAAKRNETRDPGAKRRLKSLKLHTEFRFGIGSAYRHTLSRAVALRTLDLGDRMIRRIGRRHRLAVADDDARQRL